MPQDLIGCRKRRKLKALIPRVVVFVNDPKEASIANCEVLDEKYRIAVQGIFEGIVITDWLFAFAFCKI